MDTGKIKTSKQLERHFKGIANHRRIDILLLVKDFDGITLENIAEKLQGNFKTVSEHTRRLVQAGLLNKRYQEKISRQNGGALTFSIWSKTCQIYHDILTFLRM